MITLAKDFFSQTLGEVALDPGKFFIKGLGRKLGMGGGIKKGATLIAEPGTLRISKLAY